MTNILGGASGGVVDVTFNAGSCKYGDSHSKYDKNISTIEEECIRSYFKFIAAHKEGIIFFAPKGRINKATIHLFKSPLYQAVGCPFCKVVLNLRDVDAIDSLGLGTLIHAHKIAEDKEGQIFFTDTSDRISALMKLLNVDRFLNVVPDMKTAVKSMNW